MENLIPDFILEKFNDRKFLGNFKASSMFIDISGFTSMTEELMRFGKEGAEILSDIINIIYTPAINAVYKNSGFISTFAGDAFTSIFPYKDSYSIFTLNAAKEIQETFKKIGKQKTKFGKFDISVKIGLSYGTVNWGIIKSDELNAYFFKGEAIDNCAECEQNANEDEIIFDEVLLKKIHKKVVFEQKKENYFLLKSFLESETNRFHKKSTQQLSQTDFISESILKLTNKGEFRDIVSCFISIKKSYNWKLTISKILHLTQKYGGYFNKIDFGDKGGNVLVLFGAPIGKEKIFSRACGFTLAIRNMNSSQTRFGLTYGTVFSGFVGSKLRSEYTALGVIVNLSARFMMKASWNEIYIDRNIFNVMRTKYIISELPEQHFKGFKEKIQVSLLERKKEYEITYDGKLIGRQIELKKLKEAFEPVKNNLFGGILYVHGIAGIGKSRFVNELKKQVERDKNKKFNWFYLPCDQILRKSFNPFISFLKDYFSQSEEYSKQINESNFENKLEKIILLTKKNVIKTELRRTKSILGAMINHHWKNTIYEQLDGKGRFENTLYAVKNLIKAESLQKPVILELEDGHWIDNDSRKLIEVLTRNIEKYPIFIISACRLLDDGSQFNLDLKNVLQKNIILKHLDKESSRKLMDFKFNRKAPNKLFNLIFQKSEGNPFYIEQIILFLLENDLLNEKHNLKKKEFKIPKTINSIIIARIDRLTEKLKELVQTASVLGREFAVTILSAMLDNKGIDKELLEGENEKIWSALTELEYIFKHALIRETVYEMQLKKNLRNLHKIAAETFEEIYKDDLRQVYEELANHYEKAEIQNKAIVFLEKAGDEAKKNYNNFQALELYERLMKYRLTEKLRIDTMRKKGDVLDLIGKWDEAEDIFRRAITLSEKIQDKQRIAKLCGDYGTQLRLKGDKAAIKYLKKQLSINTELRHKKGVSVALGSIGNYYLSHSDYPKAKDSYQQQLDIDKEINDFEGIATAKLHIGLIYLDQGNYELAKVCFEKSLSIFGKQQHKKGLSMALGNMGNMNYFQSNYKEAMKYYEQLLEISIQIGNKNGVSIALGNIGLIHNIQRNFAKALEFQKNRLDIDEELGNKSGIAISNSNIGQIFMDQGKFPKALEYLEKSLKMYKILENKEGLALVVGNIGGIYYYQGDYKKALENFGIKLIISRELKNAREISIALLNIGIIFMEKGIYNKAFEYFDESMTIRQNLDDKIGISMIFEYTGITHFLKRDYKKSLACLEKAMSISKNLNFEDCLCSQLYHKANLLYEMNNLEADSLNNEAQKIAQKIDEKKIIFDSIILKEKISFRFSKTKHEKRQSFDHMETLLGKNQDNNQTAVLYFELAKISNKIGKEKKKEKYIKIGLKMLEKLYDKTPKIDYKHKINELLSL